MSTHWSTGDAVRAGLPFVAAMAVWIVITAVIYIPFAVLWPEVPEANPWMHFGVYLLPVIGYAGHALHLALGLRAD